LLQAKHNSSSIRYNIKIVARDGFAASTTAGPKDTTWITAQSAQQQFKKI